jgi:TolA-binding protein
MNKILINIIIILVISSCVKNQTADELYSNAEIARNEKNIKDALSNLDLLLKKYPDHSLAAKTQYLIGDIYMNDLRDFNNAISAYSSVVDRFSGTDQEAQAQFMIGYIYANILGDKLKAEENYKNFLTKYPDHELAPSVKFELDYLGKDINEIDVLKHITS